MKVIIPEIGKFYRARILGYDDVIVEYREPIGDLHHCISCTCRDERPMYTLISGVKQISPGNHNVELLEEVKAPK